MDDPDGFASCSFLFNYHPWAKHAFGPLYLHDFLMFSRFWENWKKFGFLFGNLISNIFLTVFYFTVFALFALPYKIISRFKKSSGSNFKLSEKQLLTLEDFQKEF